MRPGRKQKPAGTAGWAGSGGDEEDRTPDLRIANATLSQLSYVPTRGMIIAGIGPAGKRRPDAPGNDAESRMRPLRALTETGAGHVRYVVRAWLIALVPSLALYFGRLALGSARVADVSPPDVAGFAAYSIVVAPLIETAVMVPLALALLRLPVASDWPRVVALAALAALAHGFGGSAWQVALAFWPFVVYSAALFAWRARSLGDAYLVAAAVHMLYNASIFATGTLVSALASG